MVTNDMFDTKIEGQVQWLSKKDSDDYISGKLTANDLRRKYFPIKKQKEKIPMQMTASTSGSGKLTVTELRELLKDIPEEATLSITTENNQRDGAFWSVRAVWGGSEEERHPYSNGKFPIPLREGFSKGVPNAAQEGQFGDH